MKAEKVIKYRLRTFAGVAALVGGTTEAANRVYPNNLPQEPVYPAIVFKRVASRRLQGAHSNPGIAYVTLQVISLARSADDVLALAEQVRLALERYGRDLNGTLVDGVLVYDVTMGSEASDYDGELDVHLVSTDFIVNHQE